MSTGSDDNGSMIFYRLKHLFLDEPLEEEQLTLLLRQHPLRTLDTILGKVTSHYDSKLHQIVQSLEEEKLQAANQLDEVRERLQHSLEDNQFFKEMIDRLEDEKKEVEMRLNQSESEMERNSQQCQLMAGQQAKIASSVTQLLQINQNLEAENSQFQALVLAMEQDIQMAKNQSKELSLKSDELFAINRDYYEQRRFLQDQLRKVKQENQMLSQKIQHKEDFIASFISEYNKMHFFQRQGSICSTEQKLMDLRERSLSHQLKGFTFNQFERDSARIEKSSRQGSNLEVSLNDLNDIQIDCKFTNVSATAEKPKSPLEICKGCESDQKPSQEQILSPRRLTQQHILKQSLMENLEGKDTLSESVSKRTLVVTQQQTVPSQRQSKTNLQEQMKRKSERIRQLEEELNQLRSQYIEQKERMTEMQGGYELHLQELQDQISHLKTSFSQLCQKYVRVNSQQTFYQERTQQLQQLLKVKEEEHRLYCQQLKSKCKAYVIKHIDQIQSQYQQLIRTTPQHKRKQSSPLHEQPLPQAEHSYEQEDRSDSVKNSVKIVHDMSTPEGGFEGSDSYSYRQLSNHHVDSLQLNLAFSNNQLSSTQHPQEMYIRDNFEIESSQGGFTQRPLKQQESDKKYRGCLTDRQNRLAKSIIQPVSVRELVYQSNLNQVQIEPKMIELRQVRLDSLCVEPTPLQKRPLEIVSLRPMTAESSKDRNLSIVGRTLQMHFVKKEHKMDLLTFQIHFGQHNKIKQTSFACQQTLDLIFCPKKTQPIIPLKEVEKEFGSALAAETTVIKLSPDTMQTSVRVTTQEPPCIGAYQMIEERSQYQINSFNDSKYSEDSIIVTDHFLVKVDLQKQGRLLTELNKEQQCIKHSTSLQRPKQLQLESLEEHTFDYVNPAKKTVDLVQNCMNTVFNQQLKPNRPAQLLSPIQTPKYKTQSLMKVVKPKQTTNGISSLPNELKDLLAPQSAGLLSRFCRKNSLTLKIDKNQTGPSFRLPQIASKNVLLLLGQRGEERRTFLFNNKLLYSLQEGTVLRGPVSTIKGRGVLMGQSEVLLTEQGCLTIARQGKMNRLPGDLEDGQWKIDRCIDCSYKTLH